MGGYYLNDIVVIQPTALGEWFVCLTSDKDTFVVKVCKSRDDAVELGRRIVRILDQ